MHCITYTLKTVSFCDVEYISCYTFLLHSKCKHNVVVCMCVNYSIVGRSCMVDAGFIQILEKSRKSWNLKLKFSRSGKSWI